MCYIRLAQCALKQVNKFQEGVAGLPRHTVPPLASFLVLNRSFLYYTKTETTISTFLSSALAVLAHRIANGVQFTS